MERTNQRGNFFSAFHYAFRGMKAAMMNEKNIRIHLMITLAVIVTGLVVGISRTEWMIIILCIGCVLSAELLNTAIEQLADFISPEKDDRIRMVKDISAGAVLIMAIIASVAGMIIFLPYIIRAF